MLDRSRAQRCIVSGFNEWLDRHFWWVFAAACIWLLLQLALGIWSRSRSGLHVFRPDLPDTVFLETWCSGRVGLTGANNCLWVAVTDQALQIDAHFPFNLSFSSPLSLFRVETTIPFADIISAEPKEGFFGRSVIVRFRDQTRTERTIELIMRHEKEFSEQLQNARQGKGAA